MWTLITLSCGRNGAYLTIYHGNGLDWKVCGYYCAVCLLIVLMTIRHGKLGEQNSREGQMSLRNAVEYEVRYFLGVRGQMR